MKPKRHIYIPNTIVKKLHLMKGDNIAMSVKNGRIKLVKVRANSAGRRKDSTI